MNIHKRLIGISWLLFGVLIVSLLGINLGHTDTRIAVVGMLAGLTYTAGGFALLANLQRSWRIALPCAALSLFSFPIGTPIGVYYLWYYFKREKLA